MSFPAIVFLILIYVVNDVRVYKQRKDILMIRVVEFCSGALNSVYVSATDFLYHPGHII